MISTAALQAYVGAEADSVLLEGFERGVVARLERETGRILASPPQSFVEMLNGPRARRRTLRKPGRTINRLTLKDAPLAIEKVEFLVGSQWIEQDLDAFELQGRLLIARSCDLPEGRGVIRVTYRAGYAVDAGPEDAQELIKQLVQWHYERRKTKGGAVSFVRLGSNSVTFAKWEEAGFAEAIEALRLPRLPRAA